MNPSCIAPGCQVQTLSFARPGELLGTGINPELTGNRRPEAVGVVDRPVTTQACDVWTVTHLDGVIAAYHVDELKELTAPPPKI
jgi:hypothetical protein